MFANLCGGCRKISLRLQHNDYVEDVDKNLSFKAVDDTVESLNRKFYNLLN